MPSCLPISYPTTTPPKAGAKTISILLKVFFIFSHRDEQIVSAFFGWLNNLAHCIYCLLCKPEERMKCPSNKALVSFKIFNDSL